MKKISFFMAAVAAVAAMSTSCTGGTPKADMKNNVDSLSYSLGVAQTQGLKEYLTYQMGMDTTYINEFIKGMNESVNSSEDKKKAAYYAGIQIGQQISQRMLKGINNELFGEDSTQTISLKNFMAGFVSGLTGKDAKMTQKEAIEFTNTKMTEVKKAHLEKAYGENKKKGEEYMANIAKKDGIKKLDNGVYYEVVTEGTGAVPADTTKVKVHYEGKLIDGTVFDSSYQREAPTTFRCNQVIPGWTNALTHMPVGSKWIVYIPQDQAYGEREAGTIKPFSTLVFTIELLSIEK